MLFVNTTKRYILTCCVVVALALTAGLLAVYHCGRERADVLFHYLFVDCNIEKFRCARFLIDNLKYHYGKTELGELPMEGSMLKQRTDSVCSLLFSRYGFKGVPLDTVFSERARSQKWQLENLSDKKPEEPSLKSFESIVSSDFLIRQIDEAFKIWESSPFARKLSLEEFQESILPFVCIAGYGDVATAGYYRTTTPLLDSLEQQKTLRDAVECYAKTVFCMRDINGSLGDKAAKGIMSMYSRDENCLDIAHYGCMLLRSYGIPVVVDHVVGYRRFAGRHYFCSLYDVEKSEWQGFNPEASLPGDSDFLGTTFLNVYRDTYGAQKDSPFFLKARDEFVPEYLDRPCMRDVTELYLPTVSITLPFDAPTNNRLAYLATFNCRERRGLLATTWGEIDRETHSVTFNRAIPNVLYFPIYYENAGAMVFGRPFYIRMEKGRSVVCRLPIDEESKGRNSVVLLRKFPVKENMRELADNMVGSVFLGSNDKAFSRPDTLLRLSSAPTQYLKTYKFRKSGSYRYYRFLPPAAHPNSYLAHLEWLVARPFGKETDVASREAVLSPNSNKGRGFSLRQYKLRDAVLKRMEDSPQYDHNPLTSAGGYPNITLQLNRPYRVEAVNLMAMHANNTITPGHYYVLFYWDDEWKECGYATAKYEYVEFSDIPADKLYWLYDATEGQEEMPFILQNGKQVFINDIIIF